MWHGPVESASPPSSYFSLPDDWASASGSINMGVPLSKEYAKSKLRLAIRELAERIHKPDATGDGAESKKAGGLLSKMFSRG